MNKSPWQFTTDLRFTIIYSELPIWDLTKVKHTQKKRHKKLKENPHNTNKQANKQKQEEQNTY